MSKVTKNARDWYVYSGARRDRLIELVIILAFVGIASSVLYGLYG